ncbi:MAG: thermonuclease family protein [Candidatus Omnitrophota bacterium]
MRIYLLLISFFAASCQAAPDYSRIQVVEVIDGDTIKLSNGEIVRYIGIDTPETYIKSAKKFAYNPQPFSLEAKEFNRNLVMGRFIRVEFDVERYDKYKRLLGYCFIEDTFINAEILRQGYASLYTRPPNVKYSENLLSAYRYAKEMKNGLWGAYETIDSDSAHNYIDQIRTVHGKVVNTYKSESCIFLNFGKNYRTDFTIVIFNDSIDYFTENNIDPLSYYRNRMVEATGRIRQYNGPEIIVHGPQEIIILSDE